MLAVAFMACGGGAESTQTANPSPDNPNPTRTQSPERILVTIGNLTDTTGPSSGAQSVINMALEDMVSYHNEQNVDSAFQVKTINYDTRLDPSRYIVGYEWLIENGADLIVTSVPGVAESTRSRADEDGIVVFTFPPSKKALQPPGYAFCPVTTYNDDQAYTALKWIAENHPDFPQDRPARIGGAAWNEPYMHTALEGAQTYCNENPDKYEWVGKFITDFSFTWDAEVEALKDCDYIIPPQIMNSFVDQYTAEGYSTTFVGIEAQMAFLNLIDKYDLWQSIDGMILFRTTPWWTDECADTVFAQQLLMEYHPEEAESIIGSGSGYLSVFPHRVVFAIIEEAITAGGGDYFDSELLYETAQSFSFDIGGALHTYTETKRTSANYVRAYQVDAASENVYQAGPNWYPISRLP